MHRGIHQTSHTVRILLAWLAQSSQDFGSCLHFLFWRETEFLWTDARMSSYARLEKNGDSDEHHQRTKAKGKKQVNVESITWLYW
jgi:hypothetical protein